MRIIETIFLTLMLSIPFMAMVYGVFIFSRNDFPLCLALGILWAISAWAVVEKLKARKRMVENCIRESMGAINDLINNLDENNKIN